MCKLENARTLKPGCGHKCRTKCQQHITQEERESIFHKFWKSGNPVSKWQFISKYACVKEKEKQTNQTYGLQERNSKNLL